MTFKSIQIKFIIIFMLPLTFYGQLKDMANTKTKQYIDYLWSRGGKDKHDIYYLYTKSADKCEWQPIVLSSDHTRLFVDSLKKDGFNEKLKRINRKHEYTLNIELISIAFDRVINEDSVFKFSYKINLTNLKSNLILNTSDEIYRSEKHIVLNAFKTNEYRIESLHEIKGTSILELEVYSDGFYNATTINIFAPVKYFCL